MLDVHDNFKLLAPLDWSDVPQDDLPSFAQKVLDAGQILCDSIPPPPDGTEFENAQPSTSQPISARTVDELICSKARPPPPIEELLELHKAWGKPLKLASEENSIGITMYKIAGKDRHGAWFARYSIHEVLSYDRFKRALQEEFATSMAVEEGPGSGAVRGTGADRRVEYHEIDGVGKLEVYQNSASFPGPTSPLEFVPLIVTSETSRGEGIHAGREPARQYLICSRPVIHPDIPERNDCVRGGYESVEMIREIPLDVPSAARPVAWIQISRSDPGGSIPRFMVERGTPSAVCADTKKFLEWACTFTSEDQADASCTKTDGTSSDTKRRGSDSVASAAHAPVKTTTTKTTETTARSGSGPNNASIAYHLTNALEAGLDQYAPAVVADLAKSYIGQENSPVARKYSSESSTESVTSRSSCTSFESADEQLGSGPVDASSESLAVSHTLSTSSVNLAASNGTGSQSKEADKLAREEQKVHERLEKKARELENKTKARQEKDRSDAQKIQDKHDKELQRARHKHDKEVCKLQKKRDKEVESARRKRDKHAHAEVVDRLTQERDSFRDLCGRLGRENEELRRELRQARGGGTSSETSLPVMSNK